MPSPVDLDQLAQAGSDRLGNYFLIDSDRSETPPWFDRNRFDAGREFFRRHVLSVIFGYYCALYVGFTVEPLANAVMFTGESNNADRSRRRYLNTLGHLYCWHTDDIVDDQSSIGYRSIRYIRSWHDRTRRQIASVADDQIDRYVSQYDTAVVQIGFVAPIILYPRQFGIGCSNRDVELSNYVYFWRVVGYVLGLEDGSNACGNDLSATKNLAKEVEQRIVVPGLKKSTPNFLELSESLIEGFQIFWPWLNSRIIRGYVYPLMGLPSPTDMTWKDYFILKLLKVHFFLMYLAPFYASYWNRKVFKVLDRLVPTVVP